MKYIRLRIANYRGITDSEVEFRFPGTTLVQGPNGAGKSSLSEAIRLLFDRHDSSNHREIEAILPVDKDEGPEVDLEAESGSYHFVYSKRFRKRPSTQLRIIQPQPENLTGRQAHDKANEILQETLDEGLWRALSIQQGVALEGPRLPSQGWLTEALDKAAGGQSADPKNEGLFQIVEKEKGLYYSMRGRENSELARARESSEDKKEEVDDLREKLVGLEKDVARAAALYRELRRLSTLEDEQEDAVNRLASLLSEIDALENSAREDSLKLELAQNAEKSAQIAKKERVDLIQEISDAEQAHKGLDDKFKGLTEELKQVQSGFAAAREALELADTSRKDAETVARIRRDDFDYYTNDLFLTQLRTRKGRINEARQRAAEAESILGRNKVDSRALQRIADAERALLGAKARLETSAPSVALEALASCALIIDGEDVALNKGETFTLSVPSSILIALPGICEARFAAGASTEDLAQDVASTQDALDSLCMKMGVADPEAARSAFEERRTATEHVHRKEQVEIENLADLTYDDLVGKLRALESTVPAYPGRRPSEPAICPDLSTAKKERANAENILKQANQTHSAAASFLEQARTVREMKREEYIETQVELEVVASNLKRKKDGLDGARKNVHDEQLQSNLLEASRGVHREQRNVELAQRSLRERNPERVRAQAETSEGSLATTRDQSQKAQTELTQVEERLRVLGEQGLHEMLRLCENQLERIEQDNTALHRRAMAAKLLFETMSEERTIIRRRYVAPLKNEIERLGRLVFDSNFQVRVDDDLTLTNATLNGKTIPFDSLSGGEKEQISLIMRLACSMIVSKDGGTPLILDDALGYTDPDRRKDMGAVLAKAAKECQIIIFTCDPERYSNIGVASVVNLQ